MIWRQGQTHPNLRRTCYCVNLYDDILLDERSTEKDELRQVISKAGQPWHMQQVLDAARHGSCDTVSCDKMKKDNQHMPIYTHTSR